MNYMKRMVLVCSVLSTSFFSCQHNDIFISDKTSFNDKTQEGCDVFDKISFNKVLRQTNNKQNEDVRLSLSYWDGDMCFGMFDLTFVNGKSGFIYPFFIDKEGRILKLFGENLNIHTNDIINRMNVTDTTDVKFINQRVERGIIKYRISRTWSNNIEEYDLLKEFYLKGWDW